MLNRTLLSLTLLSFIGCTSSRNESHISPTPPASYPALISPSSIPSGVAGFTLPSIPASTNAALTGGTITSGLRSGDFATPQNVISGGSTPNEQYPKKTENPFVLTKKEDTSTFSVDVDTASYANLRRFVRQRQTPSPDSIRIEELINYFDYQYPLPQGDAPFAIAAEVASSPWKSENRLALIGLRSAEVDSVERPPANLVFLLDVSGSMSSPQKLPLLKKAFRLLLTQLDERDRVAIVTYAGYEQVALPSTSCRDKNKIIKVLDKLDSNGSTNGSGGIRKAYQLARKQFGKGEINRVILATDGDFNVGISNQEDLKALIKKEAQSGVFLTALGFGMGNLRDDTLQTLAQNGNGQHSYIDSLLEAKKVLVTELGATLQTVAKDVKIQVVFDPKKVESYRLIGYETRLLSTADFANDKKDAGEMGAGHRVTALYEIKPFPHATGKLFSLKVRHKAPNSSRSKLQTVPIMDNGKDFAQASSEFQFAASVAAFGMLLTDSEHKGTSSRSQVYQWAKAGLRQDSSGLRKDFLSLIKKTKLPKPRETDLKTVSLLSSDR